MRKKRRNFTFAALLNFEKHFDFYRREEQKSKKQPPFKSCWMIGFLRSRKDTQKLRLRRREKSKLGADRG